MQLTQNQSDSALWQLISEEMKERLQVLRERNDGNLLQEDTQILRGQIRTFKEILSWADKPVNIE